MLFRKFEPDIVVDLYIPLVVFDDFVVRAFEFVCAVHYRMAIFHARENSDIRLAGLADICRYQVFIGDVSDTCNLGVFDLS